MYDYNLGLAFERVAAEHAERTALWFGPDDRVTYLELDRLANRMARRLRQQGIGAGDVVALTGTKNRVPFAGIFACLKIGALHTVIDPATPVERLRRIVATCRPRAAVAEADLLARLAEASADPPSAALAADDPDLERELAGLDPSPLTLTREVTGAQPAYIMFTSGSTGFPKGAVMTHANVLNLASWARSTYEVGPDDVCTNVNPLYFDNSVFDVYSTLFSGACLVPFTREETRDPARLIGKVDAAACTQWFSVPSLLIFLQTMKATDGRHLRSLKRFIFGGEGYPKAKLRQLFDVYSDTAAFYNVYGPTECTCICSSYRIGALDFATLDGFPPLGRIAENFRYLVLAEDDRPAAPGEAGELCLLGPNVGLGYYNDAERTAQNFTQNPLHDRFREVVYRTGDVVRWAPEDGKLYIQGRVDNQVKHMGYRIELEEIEAALHQLPYLSEAAVLHSTPRGLSRLTAVVSLRQDVDDGRIRADLARIVPEYMVPSVIHREGSLPKNANGKLDRRQLRDKYCRSAS